MPIVDPEQLAVGCLYSRPRLADLWKYRGHQGLDRGVVTPAGSALIILFVTAEKEPSAEQYDDILVGRVLQWEGPTDHYAEGRIAESRESGEQIHLFFRQRHHSDFMYYGVLELLDATIQTEGRSHFIFKLLQRPPIATCS